MSRILSVLEDGWTAVRLAVLRRDGGCVAVQKRLSPNPATDLCRDQWDQPHPYDAVFKLQLDHVNEFGTLRSKAPDDEAHLQAVCAYHHRTWATRALSRADSRDRLSALYPATWAKWLAR